MTSLQQNTQVPAANPTDSTTQTSPGTPGLGKRRMSLFSFGLSSSGQTSSGLAKNKALPALSTSPSSRLALQNPQKLPVVKSPNSSYLSKPTQLVLPVISPVLETESLSENPGSHIFERSVQDTMGQVKHEDYIPPALDATAQILSNLGTDLDNVDMVYSLRRNSSVIGLNMALGRPYTPLRKNSVYLVSHLNSNSNNNTHHQNASLSSLNVSQPPPFGSANVVPGSQQAQSPVSPPKLMSSRSSVSFYSYADMISNDEFSRRPSLMHAYSHGVVPTVGRKMSVASTHSVASNGAPGNRERSASEFSKFPRKNPQPGMSPSGSQSQLSKHFKDRPQLTHTLTKTTEQPIEETPLKKFLISPELSDSEDQDEAYYPASSSSRKPLGRRRSVVSNSSFANSGLDNDSFVLSSVGDCIRKCTTEIENN